jgi:outer membrane protein OmpA-like peptidoglycan-associated protein
MRADLAALLLTSLLLVPVAAAAANAPDIQQYKPVTDTHNFLLIHDAQLLPRMRPAFAVHLNYAAQPLEVHGLGVQREFGIVDGLFGIDLTGAFAIFDWWEVGLHFPITQVPLATDFISSSSVGGSAVPYGIGDIRIETRLRPLDPNKFPVGLVANLFLTLPTGTTAGYVGRGKPGGGLRVAVSQSWSRFHFAANLGYAFYPRATIANLTTDDELTYGVGVGASILVDRLDVNLEFDGSLTPGPNDRDGSERFGDGVHSPLEVLLSVRYKMSNGISIHGGIGKGLTAGFGSPELRVVAGVSWAVFKPVDRDKDGLVEPEDKCPKDAEDADGFEDEDGCPDPDNDQDGIPDIDDKCPDVAEDADGFEDEDGCPDEDNDLDGVLDVDDPCPLVPEDRDGFEDEDGCPDEDNDQDGIKDADDACPMDAETFDNWEDEDGCPDPDNDGDGILDGDDLCPDQPEVINGVKDEDGCPDDILAVRSTEQIVLLEKLYFSSGRDRILRRSYGVLASVAKVLTDNPDILQVRVEGHSDSKGRDSYNQQLSQRRAEAVMRRLLSEGVAAERLEATGFGESRPVADNDSDEGRERNRRVEFRILAQGVQQDIVQSAGELWGASAEEAASPAQEAAPAEAAPEPAQ